ncbi:MAG TPA: hypothetical protein VJW73_21770 [Gemmatimonadaceae bacterium]|nr:hypothetical protein [Gemmatimonadaceae bacterium]
MSNQSYRLSTSTLLFLAATLAACGRETVATQPAARTPVSAPSLLLAPGEFNNTLVDSTDSAGNHIMVTEWAAGTYTQPDGVTASVASVTVKTVIPPTNGSGSCITSTVVSTETTPGWTATIKKPGGCDKEIVVGLENATTNQKAEFRYLVIFGKTRIDAGAVR